MIDISVKDLTKAYEDGVNILDGLSFDVQAGEHVGILGVNGCGKTTLFRILSGEIGYDEAQKGAMRWQCWKTASVCGRSSNGI